MIPGMYKIATLPAVARDDREERYNPRHEVEGGPMRIAFIYIIILSLCLRVSVVSSLLCNTSSL